MFVFNLEIFVKRRLQREQDDHARIIFVRLQVTVLHQKVSVIIFNRAVYLPVTQSFYAVRAFFGRGLRAFGQQIQNLVADKTVPKLRNVHALLKVDVRKRLHNFVAPLKPAVLVNDNDTFGQARHCVIHHVVDVADNAFAVNLELLFAVFASLVREPNQQAPNNHRAGSKQATVMNYHRNHDEHDRQVYHRIRPRG